MAGSAEANSRRSEDLTSLAARTASGAELKCHLTYCFRAAWVIIQARCHMPDDASNRAPRIESTDLSLQDLFKDFYLVPDFQREYVWEDENVVKLFEDIYDEFYDADGRSIDANEYFVGSVVACRNPTGWFELIDQQPRCVVSLFSGSFRYRPSTANQTV
jgi:uncharacterized protein DUF262